jgi:hypothetical protein
MKVKIPEYASFSVEGQSFEPDADGAYDIPDVLVPKIAAAGVKFAPVETKAAAKPAEHAAPQAPHAAPHKG